METNAKDEAVSAVHLWYETLGDGSDQEHLKEFGIVGGGQGPLVHAYEQLAAPLRKQMNREEFLAHFRGLARMRLLEAYAVNANMREDSVQVFVEEERTMVIEGIPAMAWFEGMLTLSRTPEGWRISSLENVKPEDLIDALDDRTPSRGDPVQAARAALQCGSKDDCTVMRKAAAQNGAERLSKVTVETPRGIQTVWLVHLHDGDWKAIDTEVEAGATSK